MEEICEKIVRNLEKQNRTISFMESCTGGFLANSITNISGASNVLKVSLVTYSTVYKEKFGVDKNIIENYNDKKLYVKCSIVHISTNVDYQKRIIKNKRVNPKSYL